MTKDRGSHRKRLYAILEMPFFAHSNLNEKTGFQLKIVC
jgi:hypothetical protein